MEHLLQEIIMENGAFAPKVQMLHFQEYFRIHGISKVSKGVNIEYLHFQSNTLMNL